MIFRFRQRGMDSNKKKAMHSYENKTAKEVKGVVDEPPVINDTGKRENMGERGDQKMLKANHEEEAEGLPHQHVPQPGRDFSSEALERL